MFQPDGWSFRARLGLLTPPAAIGSESELAAMAPADVSIHATRVPLGMMRVGGRMDPTIATDPLGAFVDPPVIDDAAELLAAAPLHAIGMACNASSYVRGKAHDVELRQRLEGCTRGILLVLTPLGIETRRRLVEGMETRSPLTRLSPAEQVMLRHLLTKTIEAADSDAPLVGGTTKNREHAGATR